MDRFEDVTGNKKCPKIKNHGDRSDACFPTSASSRNSPCARMCVIFKTMRQSLFSTVSSHLRLLRLGLIYPVDILSLVDILLRLLRHAISRNALLPVTRCLLLPRDSCAGDETFFTPDVSVMKSAGTGAPVTPNGAATVMPEHARHALFRTRTHTHTRTHAHTRIRTHHNEEEALQGRWSRNR
jgi:hypothetical protein